MVWRYNVISKIGQVSSSKKKQKQNKNKTTTITTKKSVCESTRFFVCKRNKIQINTCSSSNTKTKTYYSNKGNNNGIFLNSEPDMHGKM